MSKTPKKKLQTTNAWEEHKKQMSGFQHQSMLDGYDDYVAWKAAQSEHDEKSMLDRVNDWQRRSSDFIDEYNRRLGGDPSQYRTDSADWQRMAEERRAQLREEANELAREFVENRANYGKDTFDIVAQMIREGKKTHNQVVKGAQAETDWFSQFGSAEEYEKWYNTPKKEDGSIDFRAMAQQMADELAAYESSAEYRGSLPYAARNNQQNTGGGNTYGAMASAPQAGAEDQTEEGTKHQELKRMADYYAMMADMEENRAKMEADMAQLESWSEEDRRLLEAWVDTRPSGFGGMVEGLAAAFSGSGAAQAAAGRNQANAYQLFQKLAAKYGEETVRNMAESYSWYRNQGLAEQATAAATNGAQGVGGAIGHSALSVLADTAGSITAPLGAIDSMVNRTGRYSTLDPNNMGTVLNTYGGKVLETVGSNILGENPTTGRKAWNTVYQAGMSALDNLARIAASGGTEAGALALAGLGSFGQSVAEASANGANPQQAAMLGLISGASEVVTEKIGLDKLFRTAEYAPDSLGQVIKEALKQSGSEIMEEEITFLTGLSAEALILRDRSPYKMRVAELMYSGMSYDDAVTMANQELGKEAWDTALQSAISGFMMSVPASAFAEATDRQNRPIRNQYAQQAEARLTELGVAEDQVKALAQAVARQHMGYDLSRKDANLIKGSQAAQDVLGEFQESDPLRKLAEEAAAEQTGETAPQVTPVQAKIATAETAPTQTKAAQTVTQAAQQTAKAEPEIDESWMDFDVNAPAQPAQAKAAPQETAQQTAPQEDDGGDDAEFFRTARELDAMLEAEPDTNAKPSRSARLTDGKTADIAGVATVGGGDMTLRLESGETVPMGEVVFGNDADRQVYQTISGLGISADEANVLLDRYYAGEVNGTVFSRGVENAFTYGKVGMSLDDAMSRSDFVKDIGETAAKFAHEMGVQVRKATAAKQQAARTGGKTGKVTIKAGSVVEKVKVTGKLRKTSIEGLKVLAEATGINIVVDTNLQDNANGIYDPATNTMFIDANAGADYSGTMLFTAAHELTHMIKAWNPQKFDMLADFLVEQYGKRGQSVADLVAAKKDLYAKNGKTISDELAFEEVIADSMEAMLQDGTVLAKLRQRDQTVWEKIRDYINQLVDKIRKAYGNLKPDSVEGQTVAAWTDVLEQIQDLFVDAVLEAGENYQSFMQMPPNTDVVSVESGTRYSYRSLAEAAGFIAVENEDGTRSFMRDGKAVKTVTVEDIDNSPIGALINFSLDKGDISAEDALGQKQMFAEICTMAAKSGDFAMSMQFMGSTVFTALKANADKQYGTTYDFPSICTKTQAVIDAMSAAMVREGRGLSTEEIVSLYRKTNELGNPVPCPECYVFSRWIGIGGLLDNIKTYQDRFGKMTPAQVAAEYRKLYAEIESFAHAQGLTFGKAKGAMTTKFQSEYKALKEKVETARNQGEKVKAEDQRRLDELESRIDTVKAISWIRDVYFADSSMTKVNPKWKVPDSILFDLNRGEEFARGYKAAWGFRTTQGAGYGKAITPYSEAVLGEGIMGTNNTSRTINSKARGTIDNTFLRQKGQLDKDAKRILERARVKQKIQAFLGGQRFQSTSDARYENASDYLLAALEMQAMGGMVQCYTKVDGAVAAFDTWGFSTNQSLMPKGGGLDANGKPQDTNVGGMNKNVAINNRKKFEGAGTITIGVNDNHIRAMFGEYFRDFIIPYHASGGKADVVAQFRTIQEGKEAKGTAVRSTDYSRTQGDKVLSDDVLFWQGLSKAEIQQIHARRDARIAILTRGKPDMKVVRGSRFLSALYDKFNGGEWDGVKLPKSKVESQIFPNEFWDQSVSYDESGKITQDYLDYCAELGFLHRFSGMVPSNGKLVPIKGYDQNGNRVQLTDLAYKYDADGNKTDEIEPFFWKVLTDRRMYGNDGQYLPQKKVVLSTTSADTVTGFARGNVGREYNKALADELVADIMGGKRFSVRVDSEGRELSKEQQEFFRDSKARDAQGRLLKLYHQTAALFTIFNTRHPGAGSKDGATPFGIFLKRNSGDIGLGGKNQMELYANIANPLRATNRADLDRLLRGLSPEYADIAERRKQLDTEYQERYEQAGKAWQDYAAEWRKANPGANRRALYDDPRFSELFDAEDAVVDEWTEASDQLSIQAKEAITSALQRAGYDGIFLEYDEGSWGRKTDAIIALYPEQVKLVTNETPTNNPDIRFSLRQPVEQVGDLVAIHNLGVEELLKSLRIGGMPMPSIAVTRAGTGDNAKTFGKVTVIFRKETVDPQIDPRNKIYGADVVTPVLSELIRSGYRSDATAEEYVEAMKGMGRRGALWPDDNDPLAVSVYAPPEYGSLDEVRAAKGRLTQDADQDWSGAVPMLDAYDELLAANPDKEKDLWTAFTQAAEQQKRGEAIRTMFRDYGIELTDDQLKAINAGYKVLAEAPTAYFEAKPERVVTADEMALVAVPDDISQEALDELRGYVPNVQTYENGNDSSRMEVINSAPQLRFSLRDPGQQKAVAQLQKENQKLREDISKLKDLLKLQRTVTNGTKFTKTSIEAAAAKLIKDTGAKGTKAELAKLLETFYETIVQQKDPTLETVQEAAAPAAEWLAQHMEQGSVSAAEMMLAEQELIREVYDSYWSVSTLRTFADVKQAQINRLRGEHLKRMADLRAKHRAKVQELKAEHREALQRVKAEDRARLEAKLAEQRAQYQASRKESIESRHRTEMRHKIQRVVKQLNDLLLHESKDKHVPERLKKVVTEALELFDMDTVDSEIRLAKIDEEIAKTTDPKKIAELMETRKRVEAMGESFQSRMEALEKAYAEIRAGSDATLQAAFDPVVESKLAEAAEKVGDTKLRNMSMAQLEAVYDAYKMVLASIRDANKAFKAGKNQTIVQMGEQAQEEIRKVGGEHETFAELLGGIKGFKWANLKPIYAMRTIGSDTLTKLFQNLRNGEDTWAKDIYEARDFFRQQRDKFHFDKWDMDKTYSFQSTTGKEFKLTLQQIMSLYAYSRRHQADQHLYKGGFVFDSNTKVKRSWKGITYEATVNTAAAHNLTPEILADIVSKLTPEQKGFVESMQSYLSDVMGAKGNEVSMAMYDVRLFKEKNYFPLKSSKLFIYQQTEAAGEIKLKNSGFTKGTKPQAGNPIILQDFMDVWAGHVNDMSLYHAMVLPLEDFNRVLNYTGPNTADTDSVSVKTALQNAYGTQAYDYLSQMLKDINGGARADRDAHWINRWTTRFKKGATFASLSVVFQQPSAIARAFAVIDHKYFIGKRIDAKQHKAMWEEVKKYAGVARIKEMGQFDINMGRTTSEFITAKEYGSLTEKAKAMFADSGYRDEVFGRLPALADEVTWVTIWDAVKRETAQRNPGMNTHSEEFLTKAGERFTEVITLTQVYDSVLSRSQMMRSKDTGVKMATAFMAEPTTTVNMLADGILQTKRGNKKYFGKVLGAVVTSNLINSMLAALVYAARDDDEDETYWEKYLSSFVGKFFDSLNPLTYLPLLKDVVSIIQGYDVERSDMALFADIWNAWGKLDNKDYSAWRKVEDFAGSIAKVFGLPIQNIMRDLRGLWQVFAKSLPLAQGTAAGSRYAAKEGIWRWMGGGEVPNQQQLYDAYVSGDTAHANRVAARYKDQSAVNSALKKALRENDPRIHEAALAKIAEDFERYDELLSQIEAEGHFVKRLIAGAVEAEINEILPDKESQPSTREKSYYDAEDFGIAFYHGDQEVIDMVRQDLVDTYVLNGKSLAEAEKAFQGDARSGIKEQYEAGAISDKEAVSGLIQYGGKTKEEAERLVREWRYTAETGHNHGDLKQNFISGRIDRKELISTLMTVNGYSREKASDQADQYEWERDYPELQDRITWTQYKKWRDNGKAGGVSIDTFLRVYDYRKNGGDTREWKEVESYINSLSLTDKQKDALWLSIYESEEKLKTLIWNR